MRFNKQRDANEPDIFLALRIAGCEPVRCTDFDIGARGADGEGHMVEVKVPGEEKSLTPLQVKLREIFGRRYHVVTSAEQALRALGKLV